MLTTNEPNNKEYLITFRPCTVDIYIYYMYCTVDHYTLDPESTVQFNNVLVVKICFVKFA